MICDGTEWAEPSLSRLGCQLRVAISPARAAFAAPGPLGARHATYKVRICRTGTAGRFWCKWGGERAGKSDLRGILRSFQPCFGAQCFAALVPETVWRPNLRTRGSTGASGRLPGWR